MSKYPGQSSHSKRARLAAKSMFKYLEKVDQEFTNAHPTSPKLSQVHWDTIIWNMSWLCADAVDDQL